MEATDSEIDYIAKKFHQEYEALAPGFNYETRTASAKHWEDVPDNNKRLMRAVIRSLLSQGVINK